MAESKSPYRLSHHWYLTHAGVIFSNIIPLLGAIFLEWNPLIVILIYAMETIIAGIFNVFKMAMVIATSSNRKKSKSGELVGWVLIPFFLFHYNFFVFVQLSVLFGMAEMWGADMPSSSAFNLWSKVAYVLGPEVIMGLVAISTGYLIDFIKNYIFKSRHQEMEVGLQMMEVYPRIFVQQFVVILGGWFLLFPYSQYFILAILVVIKTYAEILMIEKGNSIFESSKAK